MEKKFTCIVCPMGCNLTVQIENDEVISVTGNTCPRGDKYARNESVSPTRTLTSTVRLNDKMVSVKSTQPLPKDKIPEYMKIINSLKLNKSVNIGDVIIKDIGSTGIDIVATKNVEL